jgi:Phosphopantetheinyl transferase
MDRPAAIHVYVFSNHEKQARGHSGNQIRRCTGEYLRLCGKGNIEIPEIYYPKTGKPRFATDIGLHFSVSHSGQYWGCAISGQPIGLDIQKKSNQYQRGIAERFFHPDECRYLLEREFDGFFDIWAAKESYVKYSGQGIGDDFSSFSVVQQGRISESVNGLCIQFLPLDLDYSICICARELDATQVTVTIDSEC